ncbi:hypothetical protein [Vibrio breoganii]|uniref:Uncharacterized protein n=1 Tax=Vibrio breoganii TaxID=553239 RepID=A0ABX1UBS2_9VIBR|nr:hypothetical protein [Vibrio breoganii]NMO75405.1 hypothetical protein [Vibrio breoganii]NMR71948.1 hypothetical protein [Vibrio breoganii]PML92185.1 hypothetical protein BCT67_00280 [Vibrio breoganii]
MTKEIPIYASQMSFTQGRISTAKMKRSIGHTLRHLPSLNEDELKSIEWNEALQHRNFIYINHQPIPLEELTDAAKEALIESFSAPVIHNKKQKQKQTQLANYTAKLKQAILSEQKNGNGTAALALETLLEHPRSQKIEPGIIESIVPLLQVRAEQRIGMLNKYINAHNALISSERSGRRVRYQEIIFTIPKQWEVNDDTFSSQDNYNLLSGFIGRVLPHHEIKLAVTHGDEQLEHEDLCSHIHCFVDGQNSKTRAFDLRLTEEKAIDRFVENTLSGEEGVYWKECKKKKNYYYSKLRGEYWQAMFLLYANNYFEKQDVALKAVRVEKTQEQLERNKEMRKQAKLRKGERTHNFHSRSLEEEQKAKQRTLQAEEEHKHYLEEVDAEKQRKQEELHTLDVRNNEARRQFEKTQQDIQQEQAKQNAKRDNLLKQCEQEQQRLEELQAQSDDLDTGKTLLKIYTSIDRYVDAKKADNHFESFLNQIVTAFKALNDWALESAVMRYLKVREHEIKDYSLTKELKPIQTEKSNKIKGFSSPEPSYER